MFWKRKMDTKTPGRSHLWCIKTPKWPLQCHQSRETSGSTVLFFQRLNSWTSAGSWMVSWMDDINWAYLNYWIFLNKPKKSCLWSSLINFHSGLPTYPPNQHSLPPINKIWFCIPNGLVLIHCQKIPNLCTVKTHHSAKADTNYNSRSNMLFLLQIKSWIQAIKCFLT